MREGQVISFESDEEEVDISSRSLEGGDAEEDVSLVDLGRLERTEAWRLVSRFFPCKVGQKPAWLAFSEDIPSYADIVCKTCKRPCQFLLQIYAPIQEIASCFHRTLYVFVCRSASCFKADSSSAGLPIKIFRSQLPRENKYYPNDAPPEDHKDWREDIQAETFGVKLCNICGLRCSTHCAACKKVSYCCKEHQAYDWRRGHKKACNKPPAPDGEANGELLLGATIDCLFPEYEILIDPECDDSEDEDENKRLESSAGDLLETLGGGSLADVPCEDELSKMALAEEDRQFTRFRERIKRWPDQVIRYERKGRPLWVSDKNKPAEEDVPRCMYCGRRRVFEFQIMPQMLNYLKLESVVGCDALDWGTIAVYTCEESCDSGATNYREEAYLKQDFTA